MKGHLIENDILSFDAGFPVQTIARASSEARTHRAILEFARAVIHTHAPNATLLSLVAGILEPVDFLGKHYLGSVPMVGLESPVASSEMSVKIPEILFRCPGMVVRGHGPFVRGSTLPEAMMLSCILEDSAMIRRYLQLLGIDSRLPEDLTFPDATFPLEPIGSRSGSDRPTAGRFASRSADLFSLRLSPFLTGSLSERSNKRIWFCSRASAPVDFSSFPVSLAESGVNGGYWSELHRSVYRYSTAGAAIFSHSPRAMIQALACLVRGKEGIVPDDVEGQYLYPFIPLVFPDCDLHQAVALAEKHRLVVLAGLGVLSMGKNLAEAIHHCSSLENICSLKTGLEILQSRGIGGSKK